MATHTINYEGLELQVYGSWENSEEDTGYKGGWSTDVIKISEVEVDWMFTKKVLEGIAEKVVTENY